MSEENMYIQSEEIEMYGFISGSHPRLEMPLAGREMVEGMKHRAETMRTFQLKLKIYHTDKTWWDYI